MESIDKLREYVKEAPASSMGRIGRAIVASMADAIEREVGEMQRALTIDMKPMTDENMAEDGWIRLPKDADGVPIHVGDVMEWPDGNTFEVRGFGGNTLFYIDGGHCEWTSVGMKRHHHEPTVEDVLREFVAHVQMLGCVEDEYALVAEYAAKLRLAGDGE